MSESVFCPTCGFLRLPGGAHQCPPAWEVWLPDWNGADLVTVRALSGGSAAERAVQDFDGEDDACDAEAKPVRALARRVGDEEWLEYRVTAEATVVYDAEEV